MENLQMKDHLKLRAPPLYYFYRLDQDVEIIIFNFLGNMSKYFLVYY